MAKKELAEEVAALIKDYRRGEIAEPDRAHVERWIDQFPEAVREPILAEIAHILARSYASKKAVKGFIKRLITNEKIAGDDPAAFWKGVSFLRLQQVGNSQRDMLALFETALQEATGLALADCGGKKPHTYVYLDDAVFSGGRVKSDLSRWIANDAPNEADVAVIVMAVHCLGEYFAGNDIAKAAKDAGKKIKVTWWRSMTIEDRKHYMTDADVLRPKVIPAAAQAYVGTLGADPILRTGTKLGKLGFFSSDAGRELIEQEFLKAGARIRVLCPRLPAQMRPLGSTMMRTTGFGSMFVTYRNIANNTPLVLWAGNPWYPLFPRKTN